MTLRTTENKYYDESERNSAVPSRQEQNLEAVEWLAIVCTVVSPWYCKLVNGVD